MIVIDADRHGRQDGVANFAALVAQHVPLPEHPITKTAGDGEHHFFRQWAGEKFGNSEGELRGKDINVRGAGGFAIAPGARRPDGKRWAPAGLSAAYHENKIPLLPDWLAAMIRPPRPEAPPKPTNGAAPPQVDAQQPRSDRPAWSIAEDARVRDALRCIPSEDRPTWFEIGASLHWTGWPAARSIWDEWSQTTPGAFDAADQEKTWRSFDRPYNGKPKTLASLFHLAQANGYQAKGGIKSPVDSAPPQDNKRAGGDILETAAASTFKMRAIRWLWPGRFAIGKLGLIGGLPDMGKGLISCSLIACVTANKSLPCNEGKVPQGSVLWLTAEDDIEDTIIPRLTAAGANLDRVHIVKMLRTGDNRRMFNLVTDLAALRNKIEQLGDVVLIVIDPMSAYIGIGKVNQSMTSDVRGFLSPLTTLAAEKHVTVIGIMHFNKKTDVTNAMLRIADSLAYVAAARHVYVVVDDTKVENRRLFVKAKNNLAPDKRALSYMISARNVGNDEDTSEDIWAPYVEWGSEHVEVTATEAMQAEAAGGQSRYALREATEFLQEQLATGPGKVKEINEEAEANGITTATLRRAKRDLGVKSRKEKGVDAEWLWELQPAPKTRHDD